MRPAEPKHRAAIREKRAESVGCPRIYLHIGEPKTGTTFLQDVMWGNRSWLAAQGVVLPGYSHQDHSRASRDLRETPRVASDPAQPWAGEWDVLTRQALCARQTAVISDELLAACTARQADRGVRSLLAAEVHVILTVRDFATLLPAEWQEKVKCGSTDRWEEWLDWITDIGPAADRRSRAWFWNVHDTLAVLDGVGNSPKVLSLPDSTGSSEVPKGGVAAGYGGLASGRGLFDPQEAELMWGGLLIVGAAGVGLSVRRLRRF